MSSPGKTKTDPDVIFAYERVICISGGRERIADDAEKLRGDSYTRRLGPTVPVNKQVARIRDIMRSFITCTLLQA
jgi:hypothetical protein